MQRQTPWWNDIVQATTYTGTEGHFIGSIVYAQQEASLIATIPRYVVIDGQQRLTTLSLFLCRDVSAIGHRGNGEIEISLSSPSQLDDVMDLVRQSFEKHWEEDV